ncbi:MAG: bactofilin family protein, partial [Candidatus Zixiibacteriota bacterium]
VFNEIILTEEGVVAIDTAGYEWYYDFEYSTFVAGEPPRADGEFGVPLPGSEYDGIPIEERATIQKKVKHFEVGSVTVRDDEYVDGDIKALDMVTIKGWVKGNVISIRDRVLVTETGVVDGDIEAPRIIVKDGGQVGGEIIESDVPIEIQDITSRFSHEFVLVMVTITPALLFLGFILLALMPRQIENMESCIMKHKGRTFFLGFLIFLVMPAIVVLLAITIVGAVLIPILPVVYLWAIILGIVATGRGLIKPVYKKYIGRAGNQVLLGILGILALMTPWIISSVQMGNESSPAFEIGVLLLVFTSIFTAFPVFAGIGAAFLTRFGFRVYSPKTQFGPRPGGPSAHAPAPPPIPDVPLVQKEETKPSGSRISDQQ